MNISKPLLAARLENPIEEIDFPVIASPKYDGFRCIVTSAGPVSRNLNPIPNIYIRKHLKQYAPVGFDGELVVRGYPSTSIFEDNSSAITTAAGEPDFIYHVFDYVKDDPMRPFIKRLEDLRTAFVKSDQHMALVYQVLVENFKDLAALNSRWLKEGFEGTMVRTPNGPYKFGRSTLREAILAKWKPFKDKEAKIVGYNELLHNANPAEMDKLGHTVHSHHKDNMIPGGMLGSFQVVDLETKVKFDLSGKLSTADRERVWRQRKQLLGKLVTYKHEGFGSNGKPRFPIFKGFRDKSDLS